MKILLKDEKGGSSCKTGEKSRLLISAGGRRPEVLVFLLLLCFFFICCSGNEHPGVKPRKDGVNENAEKAFAADESAPSHPAEKCISNRANLLTFRLNLEGNCQIITGAPFRITIESMDPNVLEFEKKTYYRPAKIFSFPISVENGKTMIKISGNVYYCLKSAVGQCFIQSVNLKIPVTVSEKGKNMLSIKHLIRNVAENTEGVSNGL